MACVLHASSDSAGSDDQQLLKAVSLWIAASLARLRRCELSIDNSAQLSQVCLSVCHIHDRLLLRCVVFTTSSEDLAVSATSEHTTALLQELDWLCVPVVGSDI